MFDIGEYSCSSASADASSSSRRNKKSKNNKRRFSDEQIKSLETMFETETRLEPRKKLQLAKELGLQPRQVAIWFQNKRARWKFKQLEHDYSVLRDDYNALASRVESLKKEKHALAVQLQKLNDLLQKNGETKSESEEEKLPKTSVEQLGHLGVVSEEDSSIKAEYFGLDQEETNLMSIIEPADGSLTSQEDWGNLDSDTLFDQSNSSCAWWDFWA